MKERVWKSDEQAYNVNGWSATSNVDGAEETVVGCRTPMQRRERTRPDNDENGEGDSADLVRNMTGQTWADLPFPIIIDSVVCVSVMPTNWCNHILVRETHARNQESYIVQLLGKGFAMKGQESSL